MAGDSVVVSALSGEANSAAGRSAGLVTVLVACCGQLEYTRLCVPSLLRHSRMPYELLFLDSESLDGTVEYLDGVSATAGVRVEVVRTATEPLPNAARKEDNIAIRGEFLVLLHNDTIVTEGWLESMARLAASSAEIGMVAPMSNQAGAALRVDPIPYGLELPARDGEGRIGKSVLLAEIEKVNGFAQNWRQRNLGQSFEPDSIAGPCALLKREVLQKVGTYPTRTPLGTFDLETLSSRVRQAGYRLAVSKEAYLHHFASRVGYRR
jgi:hypothetical protein